MVVSGGPVSTVHVKLVVAERLPAPSRARTLKVWLPWVRPVKVFVPVMPVPQEANAAASMRQEYAADSFVVQLNVAVVDVETAGGAEPSVIVGATVSVVQVNAAGVGSTLPAPSTPRARKVCEPSGRLVSGIETGEVQAVKAALARLHCKVASAAVVIVKDAGPLLGSGGVEAGSIVVSGATVSTVQLKLAGVGSVLPTESVAATVKVCGPSARPA